MTDSNSKHTKFAPTKAPSAKKPVAKKKRAKKTPFRAPLNKAPKTQTVRNQTTYGEEAGEAAPARKKFVPKPAEPVRHSSDPGRSKSELAERREARAFIRERAAEKRGPEPTQKLHKLLAQAGRGSRRDMEDAIAQGRLTINNEVAQVGDRVSESDIVRFDKRPIKLPFEEAAVPRILLYHKPEGEIVSRDDPQGRATVFEKLPRAAGGRWIAIGRLDFNTSGLLIFTTSGELANLMMHPRFEVEREYAVRVMGELEEEQMHQLTGGIELDDGMASFHSIRYEGGEAANHWYNVVIKEGRNREVRRMFAVVGVMVSRLMRVRFGIVNMPPRLKRGQWLELEAPQVKMITDWAAKRSQMGEEAVAAPAKRPRQRGAGRANVEDLREPAPPRTKSTSATRAKSVAAPRSNTGPAPRGRGKSDDAPDADENRTRRRRTRSE